MTSPFMQGMMKAVPNASAKLPIRQTLAATAIAPVAPKNATTQKRSNPFLLAMNTDSEEFKDVYGINRPLAEAAFFGYHGDRELRCGKRLFILY